MPLNMLAYSNLLKKARILALLKYGPIFLEIGN